MAKRGNSEGSITKRTDGRWMARVSLPDGARKSYYGKTRQEVAKRLVQAQKAIADGLPLAGERQSTAAFLEAWLRDSAAPRVRPKTLRGYEEMVRLHISPEVGRIPIARLTPQHVERILAGVAAKGVSPRTVGHCRAVLRNALNHAMRHSLLSRNVAALTGAPKVPEREFHALTSASARRILEGVKGDRLEALFTVALVCGLRQSEALGLRWEDLNTESGSLSVQRTLQRIDGQYHFLEPKTAHSRRTIALPAPVAASLRRHQARQLEERLSLPQGWEGERWGGLVFTDEIGRPLAGFHVARRFKRLLALAELPSMRYHDLRHGGGFPNGRPGGSRKGSDGDSWPFPDKHDHEHLHPHSTGAAKGDRRAAGSSPLAVSVNGLVSKLVSNSPQQRRIRLG